MGRLLPALLATLLVPLSIACSEDQKAPFYNAGEDSGDDERDGGSSSGNGNRTGIDMDEPDEPDQDFVSEWATIEDEPQICSGWGHSCGIRKDGTIQCWGQNDNGQREPPEGEFVKLGCADRGACAIDSDGRITCWGGNVLGEGDAPGGDGYKEVDCGEVHCCAINADDELECWGAGGPEEELIAPDVGQATPPPGQYRGLSAGKAHNCAIDLDNDQAVCWGGASGTFECFPPTGVDCGQTDAPPGVTYRELAAGWLHTCGVTTSGRLQCWGQGTGDGNCAPTSGSLAYDCGQATTLMGPVRRASAGDFHTCYIDDDLEIQCQGWETAGVGDEPSGEFAQIASGIEHNCTIRRNGTIHCWGNDTIGETDPPNDYPGD